MARSITTPADLGATIRQRRRELGINQGDLAMVAGTGLRFVSELERGKPSVRLDEVMRVLTALGMSMTLTSNR